MSTHPDVPNALPETVGVLDEVAGPPSPPYHTRAINCDPRKVGVSRDPLHPGVVDPLVQPTVGVDTEYGGAGDLDLQKAPVWRWGRG